MSFAKILPGFVLLGAGVLSIGTAALQSLLPSPPPIQVHELSYSDGIVTQYRTVNGSGEVVLMSWAAQLVRAGDNSPVAGCTGSGSWPYQTGRLRANLPLAEWVGSTVCQPWTLQAGEYRLRAVYSVEGEQVTAASEPFYIGG